MAWYDRVLKKVQREPVPQHFSKKIDDYEITEGEDGALFVKLQNKIEITGGIVEDYYEGTSNYSKTYTKPMQGISIANDGLNNLTFTINGVTRTVYSGEPYNATLKPFTQLTINATDKYRVEVLS
jgi:hypothetical protein